MRQLSARERQKVVIVVRPVQGVRPAFGVLRPQQTVWRLEVAIASQLFFQFGVKFVEPFRLGKREGVEPQGHVPAMLIALRAPRDRGKVRDVGAWEPGRVRAIEPRDADLHARIHRE